MALANLGAQCAFSSPVSPGSRAATSLSTSSPSTPTSPFSAPTGGARGWRTSTRSWRWASSTSSRVATRRARGRPTRRTKGASRSFKSDGLHLLVTRGSNHTGPRRGTHFVTSTIARQIALIEAGQHEPVIYHGDLTSKRDWTDVRDMVRAYWLALERGEAGEVYNVGRGRTWAIGEMLSMQLANSTVKIRSQEDPARLRPSDVPILWADASKFQRATGWEPKIPFEQTLRDLLDYWRDRVRRDTVRVGAVRNA